MQVGRVYFDGVRCVKVTGFFPNGDAKVRELNEQGQWELMERQCDRVVTAKAMVRFRELQPGEYDEGEGAESAEEMDFLSAAKRLASSLGFPYFK